MCHSSTLVSTFENVNHLNVIHGHDPIERKNWNALKGDDSKSMCMSQVGGQH